MDNKSENTICKNCSQYPINCECHHPSRIEQEKNTMEVWEQLTKVDVEELDEKINERRNKK